MRPSLASSGPLTLDENNVERGESGSYLCLGDSFFWKKNAREGVHGAHEFVTLNSFNSVERFRRHASLQCQITQHVALFLYIQLEISKILLLDNEQEPSSG